MEYQKISKSIRKNLLIWKIGTKDYAKHVKGSNLAIMETNHEKVIKQTISTKKSNNKLKEGFLIQEISTN